MGGVPAKVFFACICLLAMAVLAGCGGDDDSGSDSASNPSSVSSPQGDSSNDGGSADGKSSDSSPQGTDSSGGSPGFGAFVREANELCAQGKTEGLEEMGDYLKENTSGSTQPSPTVLGGALKAVFLPAIQRQVDEIRDLDVPAGDEQQVEAILSSLEDAVETSIEGPSSTGTEFAANFKQSAILAQEYGLGDCAYGPTG